MAKDPYFYQEVEAKIAYSFQNRTLLEEAFFHRSYLSENRAIVAKSNERLEFLGDAVLAFLVSHYLFIQYPEILEGKLTEMRARLVEKKALLFYVGKLQIGKYLFLSKGEEGCDRKKDSIYADLFEALLGAIYLDGGIDAAKSFFFSHFEADLGAILDSSERDWKGALQEFIQGRGGMTPTYETIEMRGPDHAKTFVVVAKMGERVIGHGEGLSKKEAEKIAAKEGLILLEGEGDGS